MRTAEPIAVEQHVCPYAWCTGTMWVHSHSGDYHLTRTSGREHDVMDGLAVTVAMAYEEHEDPRPKILLHLASGSGHVDVDVSPTAAEARRIAIKLLEAADALDSWQRR